MALTFSQTIAGSARVAHLTPGMQVHQLEITTSTGTGGADYSAGFDIQGNAAKLGFRTVFCVLQATVRTSGGTTLFFPWLWDQATKKLHFLRQDGTTGALKEATGADIGANAVINVTLLGV